ncbi:MAG: hypothetical protein IKX25_08180 [Bacteroidales bacterium]|nr:hypothetical protein [Bacteroidales bacterium]
MKALFSLLLMLLPASLMAQEPKDSLSVGFPSSLTEDDIRELTAPIRVENTGFLGTNLNANWKKDLIETGVVTNPENNKPQEVHWYGAPLFPRGSRLPAWSTGYMYGSHQYTGNLMFGYIASANAGVEQHFGDYWTANAGISLQKYSVYYNTASFNGSLTWQPSHFFALTAFGYYMPGTFLSNSDIKIGQAFQWGGFATFQTDTNVPFGIDVGARQTYDSFTGHQIVPIVQPFVNVGGAKLGIDFGPLIRDALWKAKGNGGHPGMGAIPKPIKAMPPVAPRR